ncbi:MAG TPA: hypothetical protein VHP36_02675 [Chitinispirillaceae bacterium]|nr:hypothetical protein [Chitinispirillaceae bacterium]
MKTNSDVFIRNTLTEGTDFFIKDDFHKDYHFKIASFPIPAGLLSEAIELTGNASPGYTFNLISTFDTDVEYAELLLKEKIKKGINQKYHSNLINRKLIEKKSLCGRIESHHGDLNSKYHKALLVENTRLTIEEFAELIDQLKGFDFEFRIKDPV